MTNSANNGVYAVPQGWVQYTVDQIKALDRHACVAGPFGSNISSKYFVEYGVPVIRGSNLRDDLTRFVSDTFAFVSHQQAANYKPQYVKSSDLVFTCWGTIGQIGIIPDNTEYEYFIISNKQLKLAVNRNIVNPLFCFYYFCSPQYVDYIRGRNIGGAVPGINLGILKSLPIAAPSLLKQDRIVEILAAYDDLIVNNERRIALLNRSAQLLFDEWFVRLRYPNHQKDKIVNGVPNRWRMGSVADFFDTSSGGTPSRKNPEFYAGTVNWVKTQELNDNFIINTDEKITEEAIRNSSAKIFPANTVLVSMYGGTNIGRTGILAEPAATNQACCALVPKDRRAHFIFCALFFRHNRQRLMSLAQGSAQTNISQNVIRSFPMLLPSSTLMTSFFDTLSPSFAQMKNIEGHNKQLRYARDLLLPRLMDGRIAV